MLRIMSHLARYSQATRRPASSGALPKLALPGPPSPASLALPPTEAARARYSFPFEPEMHMHMQNRCMRLPTYDLI